MRKLIGLLIVVLVLSIGQMANAGPYEDGLAAYQRRDYTTALEFWRPLAEQGNASVQADVGQMYDLGFGTTQDAKEAVKWYRLSATQGNAAGQMGLGGMHYNGRGVLQDYKEAVKWYRKAAEQGHEFGQEILGLMYERGLGVAQDYVRAHMWLNLAVASMSGWSAKTATENRNRIAAKMTPAQIERAQAMARKCQQSNFRDCG